MLLKPRSKNQKKYYSSIDKKQTLKAQVIVDLETELILDLQTFNGSVVEFNLYKDTCPEWLPNNMKVLIDSVY